MTMKEYPKNQVQYAKRAHLVNTPQTKVTIKIPNVRIVVVELGPLPLQLRLPPLVKNVELDCILPTLVYRIRLCASPVN